MTLHNSPWVKSFLILMEKYVLGKDILIKKKSGGIFFVKLYFSLLSCHLTSISHPAYMTVFTGAAKLSPQNSFLPYLIFLSTNSHSSAVLVGPSKEGRIVIKVFGRNGKIEGLGLPWLS